MVLSGRNAVLLTFAFMLIGVGSLEVGADDAAVPDRLRLVGLQPGYADLLPLHRAVGVAGRIAAVLVIPDERCSPRPPSC